MGERRGVYSVLVGKPEGKRPLGGSRHRLENNTNMDLRKVDRGTWNRLIWLRTGTGGGHL